MKKLDLKSLRDLVTFQEPAVTAYLRFTGHRSQDYSAIEDLINRALCEARETFPDASDVFSSVDIAPLFAARSALDRWNCAVYFKSATVEGFYPLRETRCEMSYVVSENFHLKPLFGLIQFDQVFTLVWLEEESIKVFRGSCDGMNVVKEFCDLETAWGRIRHPETRRSLLAPVTNQGDHDDFPCDDADATALKQQIARFYRRTERIIRRDVLKSRVPVLLMGDGRLTNLYLIASKWRTSFLKVVDTRDEFMDGLSTLHMKALETVAVNYRRPAVDRALEYLDFRRVGHAVDSLAHIAGAAARGEVKSLILRSGVCIWGQINRVTGRIILETERIDSFSTDLLDAIGRLVLANGGEVHVLNDSDEMPTSSPVAALLLPQNA